MSTSSKFERSLLGHDEYEVVRTTHHPAIYELDRDGLNAARTRLRALHEKERSLAHQKRRELRGKAAARGASFPGTAERPQQRKQVFAAALKRVNREVSRIGYLEARAALSASAHRALAMRRASSVVHHPAPGETAHEGMAPRPSKGRRTKVNPAKVGSVSQATRVAQAKRDSRAP